jgi:O-antigen ligase
MRFDQLSSQSTRAATGCAIALGFTVPISVAADNVLLAVVLLLWLAGAGYRYGFTVLTENRVAQGALGLFVLLLAGIAWSAQPTEGMHMLGKYADLAFVPIFVTLFREAKNRQRAAAFFIAAVLLTLALSYLEWANLVPSGWLVGTANEPEVFKKYLTQSILIACGVYLFALLARDASSPRARLLWSVLALLAAINVTLMLSGRSGQIALGALALLFAYSVWRSKGIALVTAALVLIASVVVLGHATDSGRLHEVIRDFKAWQQGNSSITSTGQRLNYAQNSLAIFRAHPLTGVGTGGFAAAYAQQVDGTDLEKTVNPHDEYLNIAVQLGIAGLLAMSYLFVLVWRHAGALPTPLERDLARGVAVTFAVGCLFNSLLMDHVEGLFFAWCVGVLFGGYRAPGRSGETATP